MDEPLFKLPRVGWVGQRPVDRTYMEEINRRAKRREAACRVPVERQQIIGDRRQLSLPFPRKKRHTACSLQEKNTSEVIK